MARILWPLTAAENLKCLTRDSESSMHIHQLCTVTRFSTSICMCETVDPLSLDCLVPYASYPMVARLLSLLGCVGPGQASKSRVKCWRGFRRCDPGIGFVEHCNDHIVEPHLFSTQSMDNQSVSKLWRCYLRAS